MAVNETNPYDLDPHQAEVYDASENYTYDVDLIRRLLAESHAPAPLRILEPFCGSGRILIPLLQDGHTVHGLDASQGMLDRTLHKIAFLPPDVQARACLERADVVATDWPTGFELIVLGGNCFYELATAGEQERCIQQAARSLRSGGWVYIDNNHMEGALDPTWQDLGHIRESFNGRCADGFSVRETMETVGFDGSQRLARFRRRLVITAPDGSQQEYYYLQQKHPVSQVEIQAWLEQYGFQIEHLLGDRDGRQYTPDANRAIFWARKSHLD